MGNMVDEGSNKPMVILSIKTVIEAAKISV
jgi:hypothetical protein